MRNHLKSDISPMFLTYFMVKWDGVSQYDSEQKCTICARPMKRTEELVDSKGQKYEGYVCHPDKQVTWIRMS